MAATPKIFCFINSGKGTDWVRAMAIAEDGTCLAQHMSSSDEFAVRDSGFAEAPESTIAPMGWGPNLAKRAAFTAHYPEGFDLEWVDDPLTHAGLLAAYRLNQAKAQGSDSVVAADGTEFAMQSEHTRGEGRFYWIMRRDPGADMGVNDRVYDGSYDKRVAWRRLEKRVAEHNQRSSED